MTYKFKSIPHAPEIFNDFERIGLKAPVNYGELNIVLDKLHDTLVSNFIIIRKYV